MRTSEYLDRNVSTLKLLVRLVMGLIAALLSAWIMRVLPIQELTFAWAAHPAMQQEVALCLFCIFGLTTFVSTFCVLQEIANLALGSKRDLTLYTYG